MNAETIFPTRVQMPGESKSAKRRARARKNQTKAQVVVVQPPQRRQNRRRRRGKRSSNQGYGSNPYLATLLDPVLYPGVKIPDFNTFPSSTFQLTQSGISSTGSTAGDSIAILCTPIVFGTSPIKTFNGISQGSISTTSLSSAWASIAAITAVYEFARPVSACLEAEFIGPTTADGGFWDAFLLPRNCPIPSTVNGCESSLPNMETEALSSRKCKVIWRPQDVQDTIYQILTTNTFNYYPSLLIIASGLPTATAYIRWSFTANFEGIPLTDTSNLVNALPSPVDTKSLDQAFSSINGVIPAVFGMVQNTLPTLSRAFNVAKIGYNAYRSINNPTSIVRSMQNLRF